MFIDTHAHLYHGRFENDREEMIQRALDAGVNHVVMPAIDVPSIGDAIRLCEKFDHLYAMTAIHPSDVKEATEADQEAVEAYCSHEKIVAVGESGLDYYWDTSFNEKQHEYLRFHIRLAIDQDLPLILHNRESTADLLAILADEKSKHEDGDSLRGIFHCFGGSKEEADAIIDLGFGLGIGGTSTFKNAGVADGIAHVDLKHIYLETDAPFLAPVPHRGKRNESAYIPLIAERLAVIFDTTVDEIGRTTTANARRIFGI